MYCDVHSMRKDIDQIRSGKGIVGNQRNLVGMDQLCQSIKIRDINQRIAQAFNQNQLGGNSVMVLVITAIVKYFESDVPNEKKKNG